MAESCQWRAVGPSWITLPHTAMYTLKVITVGQKNKGFVSGRHLGPYN